MIQPLINFFKIIRWKNVLIYLLLQFLVYFVVAEKDFSWTDGWFFLLLSMTFFGIFGNIQNNLTDYDKDQSKKDFVSFNQTTYLILMLIFLVVAFVLGFTGFYMTFQPNLLYAVISVPVLLSLYNYYLKKTPVAGNILVALLTALGIYIPLAFGKNITIDRHIFELLLGMAFGLSLIRELAKDLEDIPFDKTAGYKTLPVLSENISRYVLMILTLLTPVLLFRFKTYFTGIIFNILLIISILFAFLSFYTLYRKQYEITTKLFKLWMLVGIFSVVFL